MHLTLVNLVDNIISVAVKYTDKIYKLLFSPAFPKIIFSPNFHKNSFFKVTKTFES